MGRAQPVLRRGLAAAAITLLLAGCSSLPFFGGPEKPKPAELQPNPATLGIRPAWTNRIGEVAFPLLVNVTGNQLAVASSDGTVAVLDASTGRDLWRASVGAPIGAGVGSDGTLAAVVTQQNEVVALSGGKVLWRERLPAQAYTAPLVAGNRVFVLAADRSVTAFDGQTGRRLWNQSRPGEPLVLRQAGVLLAVGDTLVAGQGGRLAGLNPLNGSIRWEAPIATPRGTNDVERLVDLVGRVSRVGNSVCARAFQASVGCVDTGRGLVSWTKPANGGEGVSGDERFVIGTESDGRVVAWRRDNGERAWVNDKLLYRGLSTPLVVGSSVAIGDSTGLLHVLSRDDGSLRNRLPTDGTPVAAPPVVVGNTLVVVTRGGGVHAFVPQ
ncbi:outer membrane protein assembly factor BamB [Ramlibacter henchirensis]|uniref:Outer membrane protein assembly factor BamB n=1 Tax=Ramlibacter henchirensis TaxID=204072 RepID=A0A4Z0BRH0_9BURK|nr:outer membrane protein assembly factor BamB [Ramlibacter henchirensis]TFZ01000.1 outer membrane protein assembly factor BamB [Ramlibacter henchirensis]